MESLGEQRPPRGNSPVVLAAVLVIVVAGVLSLHLLGRVARGEVHRTVAGTPVAAEQPSSRNTTTAPSAAPAPKAVKSTVDNPLLLAAAAPPVTVCKLPAFGRSVAQLTAYYTAGIACLDQVWHPVLTAVNEPFSTPKIDLSDDPDSACGAAPGKDQATAFYCGADEVIYLPRDRMLEDAASVTAVHLAVLAHEYGHHVQNLSGILPAVDTQEAKVTEGSPEDLELSRRTELEANCFAGMFIAAVSGQGSVTKSMARTAVRSFGETEDDPTHGTGRNQGQWASIGFDKHSTAACNTWTAPANSVG